MADIKVVQEKIKIGKGFSEEDRVLIGEAILEFVRRRTQEKGWDKDNKKFPKYTKEYIDSLDFKNAGKSRKPNLTLSGDMMATMDVIKSTPASITIGFDPSEEEAGRAEGNILGTYGQSSSTGKLRDFLGIADDDLDSILNRFERAKETDRAKENFLGLLVNFAVRGARVNKAK